MIRIIKITKPSLKLASLVIRRLNLSNVQFLVIFWLKNEKFTSKMISHSFESLTIEQITIKTSWTGCSLFKGHLSCQRCRCKSLWTSLSWNHEPPPGGGVCSRSSGSLEPMTVPLDGCSILIFLFPLLWCYSEESNLFCASTLGKS